MLRSMEDRLVVTALADGLVAAHFGPLFLPLFLDNATVATLDVMEREEEALIRRVQPDKITVVALVPEFGTKEMPAGVRRKSGELFARFSPHLLGAGTVIGGSGFFASLIRSVVAGAAIVSRSRVPQKAFSRVDDAIAWAAALPGQSPAIARSRAAIVAAAHRLAIDNGVEIE